MTVKEEIIHRLKGAKEGLLRKYPIASLAVFGSFAREDYSPESDVDILVELNGMVGSRFIDLAYELEETVGRKVDLVSLNGIKPSYFEYIKGDLIYV